jgi:hypothetical protein
MDQKRSTSLKSRVGAAGQKCFTEAHCLIWPLHGGIAMNTVREVRVEETRSGPVTLPNSGQGPFAPSTFVVPFVRTDRYCRGPRFSARSLLCHWCPKDKVHVLPVIALARRHTLVPAGTAVPAEARTPSSNVVSSCQRRACSTASLRASATFGPSCGRPAPPAARPSLESAVPPGPGSAARGKRGLDSFVDGKRGSRSQILHIVAQAWLVRGREGESDGTPWHQPERPVPSM